jgi:nucleoside-diphosphate-sugar epimerase
MVRAYIHVLESPREKVQGEIFNVGYHNHTVMQLGKMVQKIVGKKRPVDLVVETSDDNRSYHVSSQKIAKKLGFEPRHTIENAVEDLVAAFESGKLPDSLSDIRYVNIKTMKAVNLK